MLIALLIGGIVQAAPVAHVSILNKNVGPEEVLMRDLYAQEDGSILEDTRYTDSAGAIGSTVSCLHHLSLEDSSQAELRDFASTYSGSPMEQKNPNDLPCSGEDDKFSVSETIYSRGSEFEFYGWNKCIAYLPSNEDQARIAYKFARIFEAVSMLESPCR